VGLEFFRPVTGRIEQNRAELKGRVVGNAEFPISGKITLCVFEIALDYAEKIDNLLPGNFVRTQPAVLSLALQAHARFRLQKCVALPGRG
jgi:hypothetical protein